MEEIKQKKEKNETVHLKIKEQLILVQCVEIIGSRTAVGGPHHFSTPQFVQVLKKVISPVGPDFPFCSRPNVCIPSFNVKSMFMTGGKDQLEMRLICAVNAEVGFDLSFSSFFLS